MQPSTGPGRAARALTLLTSLGACAADVGTEPDEVGAQTASLTQQVFFDDFSAGLANFVETGEGDWNTEALISSAGYPASGSGAPAGHSDNCDTSCTLTTRAAFDLSSATGGRIEFLRFVSSLLDAGEFLQVQIWNGSAWILVRSFTDGSGDDSQWRTEVIDLAPYLGVPNLQIRFVTRQDSAFEHVHVDDLRVLIESGGGGPACGDGTCSTGETCTSCPGDCGACQGATLFSDNFANLASWTETGEGDWNVEPLHTSAGYPASGSGAPAGHADNCTTLCTLTLTNPIDLRGIGSARLDFLRFVDVGLDAGEFLRVELFDGTAWNTAFFYTNGSGDDDVWHAESIDLSGYVGVANFRIRLSTKSNSTLEHVHVDDVRVTSSPTPGAFVASQQNLQNHVAFLAGAPRALGDPQLAAARTYCADTLAALGYTVERQDFTVFGFPGQNVIGTRLGTSLPSQRVLVSAHVDSVVECPGADDNASGIAGVLETARLLAQAPHARTVVAACWDLEEAGLLGSQAYAERAAMQGDAITASFVFEMIGFKSTAANSQQLPGGSQFQLAFPAAFTELQQNQFRGDFIGIVTDAPGLFSPAGGAPFVADLEQAAAGIGINTISIAVNAQTIGQFQDVLRSDHASFWAQGYTAVLLADTAEFRNPNYHCAGGSDAPATLDYAFARKVTQMTAEAARQALDE